MIAAEDMAEALAAIAAIDWGKFPVPVPATACTDEGWWWGATDHPGGGHSETALDAARKLKGVFETSNMEDAEDYTYAIGRVHHLSHLSRRLPSSYVWAHNCPHHER